MADYLIEMLVCQALFLGLYQLFKSEPYYRVNRIYLIVSLILSLVMPLFSYSDILPQQVSQNYVHWLEPLQIGGIEKEAAPTFSEQQVAAQKGFQWNIYYVIYGIGILMYFLWFVFRNRLLFRYLNLNSFEYYKFKPVVILPKTSIAFSFLDRIYIGGEIHDSQREVVLEHEYQHLKKKHSLELLFVEALQFALWFNPLIYWYKYQLRQLHEFEVDQSVSSQFSVSSYINTLLNQSFGSQNVSFVHAFSRTSELKKRINMLRNTRKTKFRTLKYLLIIPVLALATLWSCTQDEDLNQELTQEEMNEQLEVFLDEVFDSDPSVRDIIKEKHSLDYLFQQYDLEIKNEYSKLEEAKVGFLLGIALISVESQDDLKYKKQIQKEIESSKALLEIFERYEEIRKNSRQRGFSAANFDNDEELKIPYTILDNPPHPNTCSGLEGDELKQCTSEFISKHVNANFDTAKFSELSPGRYRISVQFEIDKQGKIVNIRARGKSLDLENEAIRVVGTIPDLIPGEQDGKAVSALYGLPINFVIAE